MTPWFEKDLQPKGVQKFLIFFLMLQVYML